MLSAFSQKRVSHKPLLRWSIPHLSVVICGVSFMVSPFLLGIPHPDYRCELGEVSASVAGFTPNIDVVPKLVDSAVHEEI